MMMNRMLPILFLAFAGAFSLNAQQITYTNPVIPGFNPDPSICRVGEDYYLATSSFEYFPGVPIYHSKDLVHWQMIGHALDRPSQLNLDGVKCSAGIYAPTLRYQNGTFFMTTTLTGDAGNFIVTATHAAGPWSEPHWIEDAPGIDPSLFFDDDGKIYFCGTKGAEHQLWPTHNNIWVQQLDTVQWKLVGPKIEVIDGSAFYKSNTRMDGGLETGMNNFEAPHLYKKEGRYYIILAHGGTGHNHAVSIWASDQVFGPYNSCPQNPILTHRDLSAHFPITATGHGDLIQTQQGEWWMVLLAKRLQDGSNPLGRETFLAPVDWNGLWPVVNPSGYIGRLEQIMPAPALPQTPLPGFPGRDEFDTGRLRPEWTFIRTPRSRWWSLNEVPGSLRIALRPERISDQAQPAFIGLRQQHFNFTVTTEMRFTPSNEHEEAGLVVERDNDHYFKFAVIGSGEKPRIVLAQKEAGKEEQLLLTEQPAQAAHYLRVACNNNLYTFSYSADGKEWIVQTKEADGRFLGAPRAGRFTGTFIGMYASSNGQPSSNHADFDWFEYSPMH